MSVFRFLNGFLILFLCFPAAADRFRVESNTLFFDMSYTGADGMWPEELKQSDVGQFSLWLMEHPSVNTVAVTGPGGFGPAGAAIAHKIIEFDLDTIAYGECASACANIFMAGGSRRVTRDAKLGFHRPGPVTV